MDPAHREALRKNWIYLGENLIVDELLDHMLQGAVLTQDMYDEIRVEKTRKDKVTKFLFILQRRGPDAFNKFLCGLRETEQDFIADHLEQFLSGGHQAMQLDL